MVAIERKGTVVVLQPLSEVDIRVNRLALNIVQLRTQDRHAVVAFKLKRDVLGRVGETLCLSAKFVRLCARRLVKYIHTKPTVSGYNDRNA